jgi:hypothetical protein
MLIPTSAATGTPSISTEELRIGGIPTVSGFAAFSGSEDEVRVSSGIRSPDWVATEFNNESSPSTFYSVGSANAEQIVPPSATLFSGQTQQFAGINACSTSATWSMPGGSPGTLSAGGLYVAPASIASPQTVVITASGPGGANNTATVKLMPQVLVSISPSNVTLTANQTQMFTATVTNSTNTAVTLTASPAGVGTIGTNGVYTAPASITTQQTVTITATSQAEPTQSASVTVTLSPAQCASTGYGYQRIIVIDHTKVPNTDQTNFPFLFNTTDPALASTANGGNVESASGYDIIFSTDPNGLTKLDHELEEYNPVTGQVVAWVRIPTLSHTTDTVLYMYYGNPSVTASQQNSTGAWDGYYQAVYHLANVGSGTASDSTSWGNAATLTSFSSGSGQIDDAGSLNGTSSYMQLPMADFPFYPLGTYPSSYTPNSFAASFGVWFKTAAPGVLLSQNAGQQCDEFYFCGSTAPSGIGNMDGWGDALYVDDAGLLRASFFTTSAAQIVTTTPYNDNNWHFAVLTYDGQNETLYVDGQNVGYQSNVQVYGYDSSYAYFVGSGYTAQETAGTWNWLYFNGTLDEISVSDIARSSDWIATEYNNQKSPATFYAFYPPRAGQVVPSSVSLYGSQSQQFAATGGCNGGVNWSMTPTSLGGLTSGGLYTAPATVSSRQTVAITATSQSTGSSLGSATVNLLPQPPPIALAASAQSPYTTGTSEEFTATLLNQDGTPVIGVGVTFSISGANNETSTITTNSNGTASYSYNGVNSGTDTIVASASFNSELYISNSLSASWVAPVSNPGSSVSLIAPPALGQSGLCGAFTDSTGRVIEPVAIGNKPMSFVVPAGATQLQLGIVDNWYTVASGSGFVVDVNGTGPQAG